VRKEKKMKKTLFIVALMMAGMLMANPGHDHRRNDHHKNDHSKYRQDRKVIVVKPSIPKFILRFDVDPFDHSRYYHNNTERSYYYHDRYPSRFKGLEIVRRWDVEPSMNRLERYYERGIIDKKEYHYARTELKEMVGKLYPRNYAEDYVEDIIEQIGSLHRMRKNGEISGYEYAYYKTELLKML
jgi:hypothetical protein